MTRTIASSFPQFVTTETMQLKIVQLTLIYFIAYNGVHSIYIISLSQCVPSILFANDFFSQWEIKVGMDRAHFQHFP